MSDYDIYKNSNPFFLRKRGYEHPTEETNPKFKSSMLQNKYPGEMGWFGYGRQLIVCLQWVIQTLFFPQTPFNGMPL